MNLRSVIATSGLLACGCLALALPAPADEGAASISADVAEQAERHWAYRMPVKAAPPRDVDPHWQANPIDAFIAAGHAEKGLEAAQPASREILLRRIYFDLTGLPPSREDLHAFLADERSDDEAWADVVDRLLTSPQYGERWARHWMDVWRYSDWYGNEGKGRITNSKPHIWRWRDWIVDSLNADKGYDRMLVEMLAGDEIAPSDPEVLRATGFLVRNHFRLDRNVPLMASVDHVGRAFLGLTFDCARCHEHKYDPITHADYYRFRAFFEPIGFRTDRVPGETDTDADGLARIYDAEADTPTWLFAKGDERLPQKDVPIVPAIPAFFEARYLGDTSLAIEPVKLKPEEHYPWRKDFVVTEGCAALEAEIARLEGWLKKPKNAENSPQRQLAKVQLITHRARLESIRAVVKADDLKYAAAGDAEKLEPLALAASTAQRALKIAEAEEAILVAEQKVAATIAKMKDGKAQQSQVDAANKEVDKQREALEKASGSEVSASYEPIGDLYPATSSGRRKALAQWLAGERNPLTARVAVNHIWMRHFGEPLVPTVFDFGVAGKEPTHPELLDWLAVEFIDSGWSMKHLHRLMVSSRSYRMSSSNAGQAANLAADRDNRMLWRANSRRLESELVRDSLLFLAGKLDLAMGGPDIAAAEGDKVFRRSLYFKHSGIDRLKLLEVFDAPSVIECYRREESVVPQQALALANSPFSLDMARLIARRIDAGSGFGEKDFIRIAMETILGRGPTDGELVACNEFLREQAALLDDPKSLTAFSAKTTATVAPAEDAKQRAREGLVHVFLNHNDYVTIR